MCGLVFVKRLDGKPAGKTILKRYDAQRSRGTSGYGWISVNSPAIIGRATDESEAIKHLQAIKSSEIFFHHRTPTSTPNLLEAAHPIAVINPILKYRYYVMHNGIITNDDELKKEHEKAGFIYNTEMETQVITRERTYTYGKKFNDSEALAIELALTIETGGKELKAKGGTAFLCLQTDEAGHAIALYYGRNEGNPLKSYRQKEFWTLTSEGQGEMINAHKLYRYDYASGKITEADLTIGEKRENSFMGFGDYKLADYGGYFNRRTLWDDDENSFEPSADKELLKYEIEELKEEIKTARRLNDYDMEYELVSELEVLQDNLKNYGKKNRLGY